MVYVSIHGEARASTNKVYWRYHDQNSTSPRISDHAGGSSQTDGTAGVCLGNILIFFHRKPSVSRSRVYYLVWGTKRS